MGIITEKQIHDIQFRTFGRRFADSNISRVKIPRGFDEKLIEWVKAPKNFLVVIGSVGSGKTYLCSALLRHFISNKGCSIRGYNEKKFFSLIRSSGSSDYSKVVSNLIDNDIVIFDDLGSSGHTDWRNEIIMDFIDTRYETQMPTIITSNLTKEDFINVYGSRIASRIFAKENLVIDLTDIIDLRTRGM
jgi:DNA replication protein DnaC